MISKSNNTIPTPTTIGRWLQLVCIKYMNERQNEQYPGFARAHAPYYWLDSTQLNFRDRTRPGAVYVI